MSKESEIIRDRSHKILSKRRQQLRYNVLASRGGRPYIDAKLFRAPNESDKSWNGDGATPGRRQRAYNINHAGRVVQKINQYLFSEDAQRDNINTEWAEDVTKTGCSIRQFWETVSELFTAGQWCWLQVDRGAPAIDPETGKPGVRSLRDREQVGDRVYWAVWASTEVVDWAFDDQGNVRWLITEEDRYENSDPFTEPVEYLTRTLWIAQGESGRCKWIRFNVTDGKAEQVQEGTISIPDVPFVLLGNPTDVPWWFDDVEMIQAAILNLESLDYENLVTTVYPQIILPRSAVENITQAVMEQSGLSGGNDVVVLVREIVRGLSHPFVEDGEDKGVTRYLTPAAGDLKILKDKIASLKSDLFDQVGLALFNKESRMVASAEAKQFDHLDTESTLCNRALLLQDAEKRLVEKSKQLDSSFTDYEPSWPQQFNVPNLKEDVEALVQVGNIADMPPLMHKRLLKGALQILDEVSDIPDEEKQAIIEEINAWERPEPPALFDQHDDDPDDDD